MRTCPISWPTTDMSWASSGIRSINPAKTRTEPSGVANAFTSLTQIHLEVERQAVFVLHAPGQTVKALGVGVVGRRDGVFLVHLRHRLRRELDDFRIRHGQPRDRLAAGFEHLVVAEQRAELAGMGDADAQRACGDERERVVSGLFEGKSFHGSPCVGGRPGLRRVQSAPWHPRRPSERFPARCRRANGTSVTQRRRHVRENHRRRAANASLQPQVRGKVTPVWPWYLPPRSLYEVSQTSSDWKNSICATPSLA